MPFKDSIFKPSTEEPSDVNVRLKAIVPKIKVDECCLAES
jgi:hypothetical protein